MQFFYACHNAATGRVKRISYKNAWADVEWDDGYRRYTKRVKLKYLRLLCPVLNQYLRREK